MMRRHEEEKENGERWMLTYSDLITLLLAFFVILYGMSSVNQSKYDAVIERLSVTFGGGSSGGSGGGGSAVGGVDGISSEGGDGSLATETGGVVPEGIFMDPETQRMNDALSEINSLLTQEALQNDVSVYMRERGLVITIKTVILFDPGSANLTAEAERLVRKISSVLTPLRENQICVEGHTDDDPIHTAQYASNWELSAARATNVLRLLLENGELLPEKMLAIGYGEYRPVAANDSEAGKAKNRRVNIVILRDDYTGSVSTDPAMDG